MERHRRHAGSCQPASLRPALLPPCPYLCPSSSPHQGPQNTGPVFYTLAPVVSFQFHFHQFSSFVVIQDKTLCSLMSEATSTLCARFHLFPLPIILLSDLDFPPPCNTHHCHSASPGFAQSDRILSSQAWLPLFFSYCEVLCSVVDCSFI